MITIVGFELSVCNIEITLLILVIYESSLCSLFLVNGILLMSSLSFNYRNLSPSLLINNWEISFCDWIFHSLFHYPFISSILISLILIIFQQFPFFLFFVYLFQSINYLDSNSSLFLSFPFSLSLFINIGSLLFIFILNLRFLLSIFIFIIFFFSRKFLMIFIFILFLLPILRWYLYY